MKTEHEINVGIDTSKTQLDIYIHPLDEYFSVENNAQGIREALKHIKRIKPTRIIIEATGRLELAFSYPKAALTKASVASEEDEPESEPFCIWR